MRAPRKSVSSDHRPFVAVYPPTVCGQSDILLIGHTTAACRRHPAPSANLQLSLLSIPLSIGEAFCFEHVRFYIAYPYIFPARLQEHEEENECEPGILCYCQRQMQRRSYHSLRLLRVRFQR
jgi:hypothetical protein